MDGKPIPGSGPRTHTLGVALAGGLGLRLGHDVPKALVPVAGRMLLEHTLHVLQSCCDVVLVAAPRERVLPVPAARRVDDITGIRGPLSGMVAGLQAIEFERAL